MTTWTGDLDDDCVLKTDDGYQAHAEAMDTREWYCSVTHGGADSIPFNGRVVFHSAERNIVPLTGRAARWLCEQVIIADRWRQQEKTDANPAT